MTQTAVLPEHSRKPFDLLRDILEALVPVLLVCVIISLILFRVDVESQFAETAHQIRTTACQAVKESNDDLDAFLVKSFASVPPDQKAATEAFLGGLRDKHAATFKACLVAVPK